MDQVTILEATHISHKEFMDHEQNREAIFVSEMLDLIDSAGELTTSDLQGILQATYLKYFNAK